MSKSNISVFFLGTPEFAIPSLNALHEEERITVKGVITQPDKPSGRGHKLNPPPIANYSRDLNIPVFQPDSLKSIDWSTYPPKPLNENEPITALCSFLGRIEKPDFLAVVAYGKIIPESMLGLPLIDSLNVHPSLLPRWRGAAPLPYTIFSGDKETGVCIIKLIKELDAGPIYKVKKFEVSPDETLETLHNTCSESGAALLKDTILDITDSNLTPSEQSGSGMTYAPKWTKEDSIINWSEPANITLQRIRACSPKPGAKTKLNGKDFKIIKATAYVTDQNNYPEIPGSIFKLSETQLGVRTGDNSIIELEKVQLSGKNPMTTKDFLKGFNLKENTILLG